MLALAGKSRPRARLTGVASYLPDRVLTNAELTEIVDTTDEWIRERTGIRERRIAADDQATSDLAVAAAERVLRATRTSASDIDLIIVATTTPDHIFPPTATLVAERLGATAAAHRTHARRRVRCAEADSQQRRRRSSQRCMPEHVSPARGLQSLIRFPGPGW